MKKEIKQKLVHRKGCHRHTLCGRVSINTDMTINDDEVTCKDCLAKLEEITMSDTKTSFINILKIRKKFDE